MTDSVRYRYKGKFVTAHKARAISHLPRAKKFLTTEFTQSKKSYKRFLETTERRIAKAMAADRKAITDKAKRGKAAKQSERRKEKIALAKRMERAKFDTIAREIFRRAQDEDISGEEAADAYADEIEGLQYHDIEDLMDTVGSYLDYEYEDVDFEMADMEDGDKYERAA